MKLKAALKRYNFLKKLDLEESVTAQLANHLVGVEKGSDEMLLTPIALHIDPMELYVDFYDIVERSKDKMNDTLKDIEDKQRLKFSARSVAKSWILRKDNLFKSFQNQCENFVPNFFMKPGPGNLNVYCKTQVIDRIKSNSSAGLPFLSKKVTPKEDSNGKPIINRKPDALELLLAKFDYYLQRMDPCMLLVRTSEQEKTRDVWGFPFADTFYEMFVYFPLLAYQRLLPWRSSLETSASVAEGITRLILKARELGHVLYTVDFAAFDASIHYKFIILAFDYVKSCFDPICGPFIDRICERFYTIGIVTPNGIWKHKHGVPSGSTFTNEIDSIIQFGIASVCSFVTELNCQIQGDDGVYAISRDDIPELAKAFKTAGLQLNDKSFTSPDYCVFCQYLYHIDYLKDDVINGIYPVWRAFNRIVHSERYVDFKRFKMKSSEYFGIRTLTILENCKYHPLHPELVEFVYTRERFNINISEDGLNAYVKCMKLTSNVESNLNYRPGSLVKGIQSFETYKIISKLLEDEELLDFCKDFASCCM
jgi:hypothetical protein